MNLKGAHMKTGACGVWLLEDEKNFIDLARSTIFMTQEHEIFDERSLDA